MKKTSLFFILCFMAFSIRIAQASQVISFGDTAKYWPGWSNDTSDDTHDTIGTPNFTGGQAVINDGLLTNLTFTRTPGLSSAASPGDLFIDLGADENWDYVVDLTNWTIAGPSNYDPAAGNYDLYSINLPLDSSNGYILSGTDNNSGHSGGWHGYYIRDNHPVAVNLANIFGKTNAGVVDFSGWNDSESYSFTLPDEGLGLGSTGKFSIGWMPNCANDVIYETINYAHTPEPATLSLFGLGLLGLVGLKRKKS